MAEETATNRSGENRLLAALPGRDNQRLLTGSVAVKLDIGEPVLERGADIPHVYFPRTGVFSMMIAMEDGAAVEVGTVGNEGMLGLPVFLGTGRSPTKVVCQIPSEAVRVEAGTFQDEVGRGGRLADLIRCYTQTVLNQISQTAACNHLHSLEQRMCRWLLMTRDRVDSDAFPLTQEFLSQMLGVRRPSISVTATRLQEAGLIRYHRGRITVVDRAGLEAASCECYRVVNGEFNRLLGSGDR